MEVKPHKQMQKNKVWNLISTVLVTLVVLLAVLLVASKLPIAGNYKVLVVLSGSMEPAIHTGSVVAVKPAAEYNIGDVITFGDSDKNSTPVTHRINGISLQDGQPVFTTKGDANDDADSTAIQLDDIQGKVLFSIPFLGYVLEFVRRPLGFTAVVILPAIAIIIDELIKISRELKAKKTERQEDKDKG